MSENPVPYGVAGDREIIPLGGNACAILTIESGRKVTAISNEAGQELYRIEGRHLTHLEATEIHRAFQAGWKSGHIAGRNDMEREVATVFRMIGRAIGSGIREAEHQELSAIQKRSTATTLKCPEAPYRVIAAR